MDGEWLVEVGKRNGLRRRRRLHQDWRRSSGEVVVGLSRDARDDHHVFVYAMAVPVLDYFGESYDLVVSANRAVWASPVAGEAPHDWQRSADELLIAASDADWVYNQLRASVLAEPSPPELAEQWLIWAATRGRTQDAELAASRWLTLWEPWMREMPDNIWTAIAEVNRRIGGFALPSMPGG